jgi:hypothetical protein
MAAAAKRKLYSILGRRDVEIDEDWFAQREARFGRRGPNAPATAVVDRKALHGALQKALADYESEIEADAGRRQRFEQETVQEIRAQAKQDAQQAVLDQLESLRQQLAAANQRAEHQAQVETSIAPSDWHFDFQRGPSGFVSTVTGTSTTGQTVQLAIERGERPPADAAKLWQERSKMQALMRVKGSAYWQGPAASQMQQRYQQIVRELDAMQLRRQEDAADLANPTPAPIARVVVKSNGQELAAVEVAKRDESGRIQSLDMMRA